MSYRVLTNESNTDEWLRLRKRGIGASEMAAILGDTAWGSPLTVWQDKTTDDVTDIGSERMKWGHRMEAVIRDAVAEEHPEIGEILPSEGLLQSVEYGWLLGTLDARVKSPIWGIVPLEIKNVSGFMRKDWVDSAGNIQVPPKYTIQVRQQAFIQDDAPGGYVGVLFDGNELEVIWVPRSQDFIDRHLIGTGGDFWNINVAMRIPPDPIMGDDLASLWPQVAGKEVEADYTFIEMIDRWRDAKVREKQAKADIEVLKFYFGTFFEDAQVAVAEGQPVMKMQKRSGQHRVVVKTHAEHHPDCTECVTQDRDSYSPNAVEQTKKKVAI